MSLKKRKTGLRDAKESKGMGIDHLMGVFLRFTYEIKPCTQYLANTNLFSISIILSRML